MPSSLQGGTAELAPGLLPGCLGGAGPASSGWRVGKGDPKNHKREQVTSHVAQKYMRLPVGHHSHSNIGVSDARINSKIQM